MTWWRWMDGSATTMWDTLMAVLGDGMASNWGLGASLGFMAIGCSGLIVSLHARRSADEDDEAVEGWASRE